jgi:transposase
MYIWYIIYIFSRAGKTSIGSKRGRPKEDEPLEKGHLIEAEVERNEEIIVNERERLGRFVLASNDRTLDGELMLQYYKGQNAVERVFDF